MITRSSIAFEDFLGSSIAPQVMPPCFGPASSTVKRLVERAGGASTILYNSTDACSQAEVEEWLRRRRSGEKEEERKCLVTDRGVTRGWEASHVLV